MEAGGGVAAAHSLGSRACSGSEVSGSVLGWPGDLHQLPGRGRRG